jgi:DNA modification methylase
MRVHTPGKHESNGDLGSGVFSKAPDKECPICHGSGIIPGMERMLGSEPTIHEYLLKMVEVFHEIKRVLRSDGTCWVNMGDCYYSSGPRQHNGWSAGGGCPQAGIPAGNLARDGVLKSKDLAGQPWRLAFALQDDGWYLRSDIIWEKPNPMPESVTDRPAKCHEYIFLLSKSGDNLYWSHRENGCSREQPEPDYIWVHRKTKEEVGVAPEDWIKYKGKSDWMRFNLWEGHYYFYDQDAIKEPNAPSTENNAKRYSLKTKKGVSDDRTPGEQMAYFCNTSGRNSRTVWTIPTQPYPEAHFATFPEELPRRCIKAATSERGCCPKCGAPWERVVQKEKVGSYHDHKNDLIEGMSQSKQHNLSGKKYYEREAQRLNTCIKMGHGAGWRENPIPIWRTIGWRPTCECGVDELSPCIVLDPFGGSGTTGAVARALGRSSIMIEINPVYVDLIEKRTRSDIKALEFCEATL